MQGNWKVHVRDAVARFGKTITIFAERGDKIEIYNPLTQEVHTINRFSAIQEGEHEMYLDSDMLQALFDALQKGGMKPTSQSYIEGAYEAQSDHLADLRHLLKLPNQIITMEAPKINLEDR